MDEQCAIDQSIIGRLLNTPFGFSLFYLRSVAPPEIRTQDIYRGVIPFVLMQLALLLLLALQPEIVTWLPGLLKG